MFFTLTSQLLILIVLYKRASTVQCTVFKCLVCCGLTRREHCPVEYIYQLYGWKLAIGRIMLLHPKDTHILIPRTWDHAMSYGREDLRTEEHLGLVLICKTGYLINYTLSSSCNHFPQIAFDL